MLTVFCIRTVFCVQTGLAAQGSAFYLTVLSMVSLDHTRPHCIFGLPTPWICQPHGILICSVPHSWGLACVSSLVVAPSSGTAARGLAHLTARACAAGKYTVPVLWDKKTSKVVNNESSEIIRIFNAEFNDLAKNPNLDLYPEALRGEIDAVNEWTYPCINNGVYRAGFAQAQAAYESAFNDVFSGLDRVEAILAERRYLAGDVLTEADIRLFMTLIRFDPVYVVYFKCNKRFISQYPNIREYTKELYQMDGIKRSVNMYHIKVLSLDLPSLPMLTGHRRVLHVDRTLQSVMARLIHRAVHVESESQRTLALQAHYFTSHPALNTYAVIPVGCDPWWEEPHNRNEMHPVK